MSSTHVSNCHGGPALVVAFFSKEASIYGAMSVVRRGSVEKRAESRVVRAPVPAPSSKTRADVLDKGDRESAKVMRRAAAMRELRPTA